MLLTSCDVNPIVAPRNENRRSWLYRTRPSAVHDPFLPVQAEFFSNVDWNEQAPNPNQVSTLNCLKILFQKKKKHL